MPRETDLRDSDEIRKLLEEGRRRGGVLTYEEISDRLTNDVDPDHIDQVLQLVAREGIQVVDRVGLPTPPTHAPPARRARRGPARGRGGRVG